LSTEKPFAVDQLASQTKKQVALKRETSSVFKLVEDSHSTIDTAASNSKEDLAECHVCMANEANIVLMPCGHGGLCKTCLGEIVRHRVSGHCPQCRSKITAAIEVTSLSEKMFGVEVLRHSGDGYCWTSSEQVSLSDLFSKG